MEFKAPTGARGCQMRLPGCCRWVLISGPFLTCLPHHAQGDASAIKEGRAWPGGGVGAV